MTLGRAYLWTSASLAGGVALSIYEQDWAWFARSGSLIVIIGILLTSALIIEELQHMRHRRTRGDQESWSSHDWADEAENHKKLRAGEEEFSGRSHGLYLLVLGTLVWGFGDVLGRFFV